MTEASKRLQQIQGHIESNKCSQSYMVRQPSLDDVVIVATCRTPLTKAKRGGLKDTYADELLAVVLKEVLRRTGVEPEAIGDISVGSVLGNNALRANEARMAQFEAGIPETVPIHTTNRLKQGRAFQGFSGVFQRPRIGNAIKIQYTVTVLAVSMLGPCKGAVSQCSSGLQAIAEIAANIKAGYFNIGIGSGVETMSINKFGFEPTDINPRIKQQSQQVRACLIPMGITSENVAAKFGVDRDTQDKFSAASHNKAFEARANGNFKEEIVPVTTRWRDPKSGEEKEITVYEDDGIRPGMSAGGLAKLPPAFKKGGSTTAGNSSQVTDGASATLLMSYGEAKRRGLPVLGIFRSFAAVGVPPEIMGIGPSVAIPKACELAGLSTKDIDVFEINEAFASQATYCVKVLGLDESKVNPNGGAIALGHPLGCTGSRLTATLLYEMKRRGNMGRFGIVSMCIGSGMGAAAVFERGANVDELSNAKAVSHQTNLSMNAIL